MGKVGNSLCKQLAAAAFGKKVLANCLATKKPLEKRYAKPFAKKGCAANSQLETCSEPQNLWKKGASMLLQQVGPLEKRYGKAAWAMFFQLAELSHFQPSKKVAAATQLARATATLSRNPTQKKGMVGIVKML